MIPQIPKLFVILVHYGDLQATKRAVASIQSGTINPDILLVVDHGDTPIPDTVKTSTVEVVRPPTNSGYSGGILTGIGFLSARGAQKQDVVVCINNDAQMSSNALQIVWDELRDKETLHVFGVQAGQVNMFSGRSRLHSSLHRSWYQYPYLHGSFFAAPLRVFETTQLPSEYFLYWEDVVWSWRLMERGVSLKLISPDLVQHPDRRPPSASQRYYLVRNGAYTLSRHGGAWRGYWIIVNTLRLLYHCCISKKSLVIRALVDARSGRLGKMSV